MLDRVRTGSCIESKSLMSDRSAGRLSLVEDDVKKSDKLIGR
jgi:hypothetical protein